MFTDANYKFCSNCLGLWVKCRRQFICLGFCGGILTWSLQMKSTSYLEGPTEQGCHLWEVMNMNSVLVSGRNWRNCCVIEQWIENALVSQGRAEGWAIISRGEAFVEFRGLTHLAKCFSWASHLTVTNIKQSQASGQVCWEPQVCADLCLWVWLGGNTGVLVSFSCCAVWFCLLLSHFRKSG